MGNGPSSESSDDVNQGYYGLDNVYVYNMWTDSTVINATDLQALTTAAHHRRSGSPIPEPTSAAISLLGLIGWAIRRRHKATAATV